MRIRGVRTVVYEYTAVRPIGDVQLPHGARRVADVAVFLTTDEEPVGVGLASPRPGPSSIPSRRSWWATTPERCAGFTS